MNATKILLVDDDEPTLEMLREVLQSDGCLIVQARDGVEALDKFEKLKPDLVLLDLMLPRLNGYEVCSRLRRNERTRHIPIIMLTGFNETDIRLRALATGVDDFLAKPVENAELLARVRTLLRRRPYDDCHARQAELVQELRSRTAHLQRTLRLIQRQPSVHQHEQVTELLAEAMETCNRLDEALGDE